MLTTAISDSVTSNPTNATVKVYYPALTGLRAIAAFMVFLVHSNPMEAYRQPGSPSNFLREFIDYFNVGVSIFFVLSGFLIAARYQQSITLSWQWWRRYMRNRVARIYPLYLLVTIITFIASQISIAYDPSRVWKFYHPKEKLLVLALNLTFLRGFFERFAFTLAGQGWSLTVEECFYLCAPFLLLGLSGRNWRLVAYPFMLLGTGLLLTTIGAHFYERLFSFFGSIRFMLNWTFFGRCIEFLVGMALALLLARRPEHQQSGRYPLATAGGLLWISLCICAFIYLEKDVTVKHIGFYNYSSIFVGNVILPIGIVLVLWGLIMERSWLSWLLETPVFELLGRSSYAFYLIHVGVLNFVLDYFVTRNIGLKFVIINLVAIGLYKLVEHPIHSLLTRRKS